VIWLVLAHFLAFLVDPVLGTRRFGREQDLRNLVLWKRLRPLPRQCPRRLTHGEEPTLALMVAEFAPQTTGTQYRRDRCLLPFRPDTILNRHREPVRHKRMWQAPPRCQRLGNVRGPPAVPRAARPQRRRATIWRGCFTVETLCPKMLPVLFFIELGLRRLHLAFPSRGGREFAHILPRAGCQ
jgi:hypothetical protein